MNKTCLIKQPAGLGDILLCLKNAKQVVEDYNFMELAVINTTNKDFDYYTVFGHVLLKMNRQVVLTTGQIMVIVQMMVGVIIIILSCWAKTSSISVKEMVSSSKYWG